MIDLVDAAQVLDQARGEGNIARGNAQLRLQQPEEAVGADHDFTETVRAQLWYG